MILHLVNLRTNRKTDDIISLIIIIIVIIIIIIIIIIITCYYNNINNNYYYFYYYHYSVLKRLDPLKNISRKAHERSLCDVSLKWLYLQDDTTIKYPKLFSLKT